MQIEHIAIWTDNLELLKEYYVKFFNGKSNEKYRNPKTQLETYFISFDTGCRLEIMYMPNLSENNNEGYTHKGLTHIAFEVENRSIVDAKAEEFRNAGFPILRGPRVTGDGYYEFETVDPDRNKIEIATKNVE